jgi:sugar (pentulose or hexulose) kinase
MHATIPIDRAGQVLVSSVQLWCDKRAAESVTAFEAEHSPSESFPIAGNYPTTAWQRFRIKWLQRHQPDIYAKAWKIITASTFSVF